MEKFLERIMYSARWILAPIYLGLSLVLMLLAVKFFQEIIHTVPYILEKTEAEYRQRDSERLKIQKETGDIRAARDRMFTHANPLAERSEPDGQ